MTKRNQLKASTNLSALPLVQITFAKDGEPDHLLTLSPVGLRDYFTALTMEYARDQPIDEATFAHLAATLQVQLTDELRRHIIEVIIGTTLMVVRKWYSPRTILSLLKNLQRDPLGTIDREKGDTFAEFVIATIQDEAVTASALPRDIIKKHISAIRDVVSPGRPDEEARGIFIETIVEIARRQGNNLVLPERDSASSTTLFEFGAAMRDLVVDYGHGILDRRGLPRGRFDGFTRLERERLIWHLVAARKVILQGKPTASVNSTIPSN